MSRFDQDTSTMRMRMENTLIELRKPELGPQSKARGILVGALLGALAGAAIFRLAWAVWGWPAKGHARPSPGHRRGGARERLTVRHRRQLVSSAARGRRAAHARQAGVIGRAAQ